MSTLAEVEAVLDPVLVRYGFAAGQAGDAAVAFAEHGWRVLLQLDPDQLPAPADPKGSVPTVLAVSTSTRALTDDEAAAATARVIEALRAAGLTGSTSRSTPPSAAPSPARSPG